MKNLSKKMALMATVALLTGNLLVFNSVKTVSVMLQFGGEIEAMAQNEGNWEGKKLKIVDCTCPDNKKGQTFKCNDDGNLESCTSTQQGSNGCYKVGLLGISLLCE